MSRWVQSAALAAALAMGAPACAVAAVNIQKVEVVSDAANTAREAADLHAQQVAAWWTRFAAITSTVGLLVSAGGLFLIWQQLRHSEATMSAGVVNHCSATRAYPIRARGHSSTPIRRNVSLPSSPASDSVKPGGTQASAVSARPMTTTQPHLFIAQPSLPDAVATCRRPYLPALDRRCP
ncbi:hypothetical protein D3C72_315650 [compost metagenome]